MMNGLEMMIVKPRLLKLTMVAIFIQLKEKVSGAGLEPKFCV